MVNPLNQCIPQFMYAKGVREMKQRPIIMSVESVQAILDGRKTQTRRVVKNNPKNIFKFNCTKLIEKGLEFFGFCGEDKRVISKHIKCPYGKKGDRLWVKESFHKYEEDGEHIVYKNPKEPTRVFKRFESYEVGKWNSPLFMPRSLSRLTLEITNIRVERLQDITEDDAIAEGIKPLLVPPDGGSQPYVEGYRYLWDKLNAKRGYSWESNPFVWVIEFRRLEE